MKNRGIFKGVLGLSLLVVASNNLFINNVKALELNEDINGEEIKEEIIDNTLSKEEILNSISIDMEFNKDNVVIKGKINETTTVEDILNNIHLENLKDTLVIEKVGIINEDGNFLISSDIVTSSCSIIFISDEFALKYQITFWGDFDEDAMISDKDINVGIDDYLEQNVEENVTPEDISSVSAIVNNDTYEVESPVDEDINVNLEYDENTDIYVDDNFKVELKINGFINNYMNIISGTLRYDNNILKLEKIYFISDDKVVMGDIKNNKFIYLLNNYCNNDILLVMEFKTINEGATNIYLDDLKLLMNGFILNQNSGNILSVNVNSYGKGGDVEINNPPSNVPEVVTNNDTNKKIDNVVVNNINNNINDVENDKGSFIKNIEINNYNINFNKDIKFYTVDVSNDIDSLDINIELSDDMTSYAITGNEKFKVGKNEVIITLLSKDGSSTDYVIEVNKAFPKIDDNDEKEGFILKNNLMFIPVVSLIIVIILLLYKLIRKST